MQIRLEAGDPGGAEILALLEDGERHAAALYPAESNHFVSIDGLRAANVRFLVARDGGGAAVGTGALVLNDGWAEIKRMWVVPGARGRGISKTILAELERLARDAGMTKLRLETGNRSEEALGLYGGAGFAIRDAFDGYVPDPFSVFMEKKLP